MKKTIKGKKLKKGKKPDKTILNELVDSQKILFREKDTGDSVVIDIKLKENQYAVFSEEYLPATREAKGGKKADITTAIFDEDIGKMKYYIADVKSNLQGEDQIYKLCEQWEAGLRYVKNTILAELQESIQEEEHILAITRKIDDEKINHMIKARERRISGITVDADKDLAAAKMRLLEVPKLQKECDLLKLFVNRKFRYSDRYMKNQVHDFEVCTLLYDSSSNEYKYILNLKI